MAGQMKPDMDRVGIFKEMGYISIGDPYTVAKLDFNQAATKGKQVLAPGSKTKNATQAGYFSDKYSRILDGEAYSDPVRMRRQWRLQENKKIIAGRNWVPASGEKKPSGLGSYYGTVGGKVEYFAAITQQQKKEAEHKKNFTTNPGKKGTGYGYSNVGMDKYPEHSKDDYNGEMKMIQRENAEHKKQLKAGAFKLGMHPKIFFEENPYKTNKPTPPNKAPPKSAPPRSGPFRPSNPGKILGGNKSGGFEKWPAHSEDKYVVAGWQSRPVKVVNSTGKTFVPNAWPKSTPARSIIYQNVEKAVNNNNYKDVKAVTACA